MMAAAATVMVAASHYHCYYHSFSLCSLSVVVVVVISNYSLDFLHFGGDDNWVALPDFLGTEFLVVEVALVLITVTVY